MLLGVIALSLLVINRNDCLVSLSRNNGLLHTLYGPVRRPIIYSAPALKRKMGRKTSVLVVREKSPHLIGPTQRLTANRACEKIKNKGNIVNCRVLDALHLPLPS